MIVFLAGFGSALVVMALIFAGLMWWIARTERLKDLVGVAHTWEGSE
jgi:hypothetical protein